jgi:hypothetical protein
MCVFVAHPINANIPAVDVNGRLLFPMINPEAYNRWKVEIQRLAYADGVRTHSNIMYF